MSISVDKMHIGRVKSVELGNYIGTRAPYGYDIVEDKESRWLVANPDQSEIVKLIFDWYSSGELGTSKIANRLNDRGFKSYTGMKWTASSVLSVLKNEVYIGRTQWGKKELKETPTGRVARTRDKSEVVDAAGKHVALISDELFARVQGVLNKKSHKAYRLGVTNPLAGIVICGKCGYSMIYKPYKNQPAHLLCHNTDCDCRSARYEYVENKVHHALRELLWTDHRGVIDIYENSNDNENINNVLKSVIEKIEYRKSRQQRGNDFEIDVFLRE